MCWNTQGARWGWKVTDKAVGLQPGTSPRSQRSCAAKSQQGRLAEVFLGGVAQCGLRKALESEKLTLWGAGSRKSCSWGKGNAVQRCVPTEMCDLGGEGGTAQKMPKFLSC